MVVIMVGGREGGREREREGGREEGMELGKVGQRRERGRVKEKVKNVMIILYAGPGSKKGYI